MSLRDHDSGRSSNYLDVEEVVELLHVMLGVGEAACAEEITQYSVVVEEPEYVR